MSQTIEYYKYHRLFHKYDILRPEGCQVDISQKVSELHFTESLEKAILIKSCHCFVQMVAVPPISFNVELIQARQGRSLFTRFFMQMRLKLVENLGLINEGTYAFFDRTI